MGPRTREQLALLGLCLGALALGPGAHARAEDPGDGVYGRLDADSTLAFGLGGGVELERGTPAICAELRLRFLDAAGPLLGLRWEPAQGVSLLGGVELRPLWPALFLSDRAMGRERLELLLHSLGVELGASLALGGVAAWGWFWGVGAELPIVLPSSWARGLWLRLGARQLLGAHSGFTLTLSLRVGLPLNLGFAAWEPPRYRP
ncbi:MAG: hypothetical protein OEY14_01920 [Myxococcales bacterium]|nr:hypothetical protein [Myxococcales bacterium]